MPSKTLNARKNRRSPKKAAPGSSEFFFSKSELQGIAEILSRKLKPGDRIFLEGELGTGKSTFARFLLEALGQSDLAEGSPTFPIAHEYETRSGSVIHIDFYRLKSEAEIEAAGILSYFWERQAIVITEWFSQWKKLTTAVRKEAKRQDNRVFQVQLKFTETNPDLREVQVKQIS